MIVKKKKNILILLAIVCFFVFLTACDNMFYITTTSTEIQAESPLGTKSNFIPEETKKAIAQQLLVEFEKSYSVLNLEEFSENRFAPDAKDQYNRIMALDRAIGITGVYADAIAPEALAEVLSKQQILVGGARPVRSGYTKSGVHILALKHPNTRAEIESMAIADQLRGAENEASLLTHSSIQNEVNLNLWDVYVEDLTGQLKEFDVNICFYTTNIYEKKDRYQLPNIYVLTEEQKKFLTEYDRTLNGEHKMPNQSWKLFAVRLETPDVESLLASDDLAVAVVNGEEVELKNYY